MVNQKSDFVNHFVVNLCLILKQDEQLSRIYWSLEKEGVEGIQHL
jgi:hypothetical protein